MVQGYGKAGIEPTVEELMADPIVHVLLAYDRIRPADAWAAIETARRRLARGPASKATEDGTAPTGDALDPPSIQPPSSIGNRL